MSNKNHCNWVCDLCPKKDISSSSDYMPDGWRRLWLYETRLSKQGRLQDTDELISNHYFDVCNNCYPSEDTIRNQSSGVYQDRVDQAKKPLLRKIMDKIWGKPDKDVDDEVIEKACTFADKMREEFEAEHSSVASRAKIKY